VTAPALRPASAFMTALGWHRPGPGSHGRECASTGQTAIVASRFALDEFPQLAIERHGDLMLTRLVDMRILSNPG
jgi:hypothetical protein